MAQTPALDAAALRAAFDAPRPLTVGLEEELMLLDFETLDLLPRAADVTARAGGDPRFKLELPAAQLEIVLPPAAAVPAAVSALGRARAELANVANGIGRLATAGVHPFAAPLGVLNAGEHYERLLAEYGDVARRQLVCSLQVHVAVGGAARTLAVYNALRGHLPEIAALAANAPFHDGRDTGFASVRPKLAEGLPRQGVPPALASWEAFAGALRWGAASGVVPTSRAWWWELRPHPVYGTLELRVPDAQTTVRDAAGVAAFVQCLAASLAQRHDAGEPLGASPTWRIEENRWVAARHGLDGSFADLVTGERRPVREVLRARLDALAPVAERLGCARELEAARALAARNGAVRQREAAARGGVRAVVAELADGYLAGAPEAAHAARDTG